MQFNPRAEIAFASEIYKKAIDGLKKSEYPPEPYHFLENGDELVPSWLLTKQDIMQGATSENMADIHAFMKCALAKYMDFMCALYGKMSTTPVRAENSDPELSDEEPEEELSDEESEEEPEKSEEEPEEESEKSEEKLSGNSDPELSDEEPEEESEKSESEESG